MDTDRNSEGRINSFADSVRDGSRLKVSIIGPSDPWYITGHTRLTRNAVINLTEQVGRLLAKHDIEIIFVPDTGVAHFVAKAYKKADGPKVIGIVPKDPEPFGVRHLEPQMEVVDEVKELPDWYNITGKICREGDFVICMGTSPGTMAELSWMKFYWSLFGADKRVIVFLNTLSNPIPSEVEEGLWLIYIDSVEQLEEILERGFSHIKENPAFLTEPEYGVNSNWLPRMIDNITRSAGCLIEYDGKFLILRRKSDRPEGGTWGPPGGKIEGGETDIEAVLREIKEETGLDADLEKLEPLGKWNRSLPNGLLRYSAFRVRLNSSFGVKIKEDEHAEYKWVTPDECHAMKNLIHGFHELLESIGYAKGGKNG